METTDEDAALRRRDTKNRQSIAHASRVQPLALAFVGGADLAGVATGAHAKPASAWAVLRPGAGLARPDGSILRPVENCNDTGAGSLRDAASLARAGDGIDLGGLACSTISVRSGAITLRDVDLIGTSGGGLRSTSGNVRIRDAAFTNCLVATAAGADGYARGG